MALIIITVSFICMSIIGILMLIEQTKQANAIISLTNFYVTNMKYEEDDK